jgi:DNA-binding response OmpR family regulator
MALPALSQVEPSGEPPPLRGRRVLLVDDDPVLLRTWSRALERHGLIVRVVSRIAEARRALARWKRSKFDYALIDDRLPDGFGLDLVPALAELRPAIGFAVVSALPSTERALRAWQNSTVIVPKPASPAGLRALLGFLDARRGKTHKHRYKPAIRAVEAIHFGAFVLDADGLSGPRGPTKLAGIGRGLLAELVRHNGFWVPTLQLAHELYALENAHGAMLVRRQVSLLRGALGTRRWIVESALQRGYRIAPLALASRNEPEPPEPTS